MLDENAENYSTLRLNVENSVYPLAEHRQDLDFVIFLGQGI